MSDNSQIEEKAVDRSEVTVTTQQPGYAATEQVTRDVAAERRQGFTQVKRIAWTLLAMLEILLAIRFVLHLIAANTASGFTIFINGVTGVFVAPFNALVGTPTSGGAAFEATTLIAMAIYWLLCWVIVRVIQIFVDRPSARSVTRSTHEQTPGGPGNERTVQTVVRK